MGILIFFIVLFCVLYFIQLGCVVIGRLMIEKDFESKKEFYIWCIPIYPMIMTIVQKVQEIEE